jgi:hypothetical protein
MVAERDGSAGEPGGEPATSDRPRELPSVRERLADNLALVVTALGSFIVAAVLAPLQRLGRGWLVAAAAFALGAVVAMLALLRTAAPSRWLRWLAGGLAGCAVLALGFGWLLRPAPVHLNAPATLVLVDTSQAMAEPLPDAPSKLQATVERVRDKGRSFGRHEQLGLATYGVDDCGDPTAYRLRSPIAGAGGDRIRRAVAGLRPDGQSNLATAARQALAELAPFTHNRHLLVVTGGADDCRGDLGEVVSAARRDGIDVSWDIVGLGLDGPLPVAADGQVRVHYASSKAELEPILDQLLVTDPAAREFDELQDFLDERVRPELNAADEALDDADADRAQENLAILETRFQEGENRFLREPAVALGPRCQAVAAFERGQFRHLEEALPVLTERVEVEREHRRDPSEELARRRQELSATWDDKVKAYNEALETLPGRVKDCLDELSEGG